LQASYQHTTKSTKIWGTREGRVVGRYTSGGDIGPEGGDIVGLDDADSRLKLHMDHKHPSYTDMILGKLLVAQTRMESR